MKSQREQLLRDLDFLLADLCRDWGFCNRLSAADLISSRSALRAREFAETVLRAEKMNPDNEPNWVRRIGEKFSDRFGTSISLKD
jgi:hypothetical protein